MVRYLMFAFTREIRAKGREKNFKPIIIINRKRLIRLKLKILFKSVHRFNNIFRLCFGHLAFNMVVSWARPRYVLKSL